MKQLSGVLIVAICLILDLNIGSGQGIIAFEDSFSQGNTNDWTWQTGSWTLAEGVVSTAAVDGHHFLIEPHYLFSDFTFRADVMKIDDSSAEHPGLVFRWMNDTMNYVFRINGVGSQSWIQLVRDMDNRDQNAQIISTVPWFTEENSYRMYKGVWYTMKVEADSSRIKCKVWRTSDTEPSSWNLDLTNYQYTQGKIGLEYYTGAHQFDNVVVTGEGMLLDDVFEVGNSNPKMYALRQNYPNPFNPTTEIKYSIPKETFVRLKVYNMLGQEVISLVNEWQAANNYSTRFDASTLSSGVYYYRLLTNEFSSTRKMLVMR